MFTPFFTIYPGSIKDVSTLKNILIESKELGIKDNLFVVDKGLYSKNNIEEMKGEKIKFLMPLPFTTKSSHFLIHKYQTQLSNPLNSFIFGKRVIFHLEEKMDISGVEVIVHLYLDEKRKGEEIENFLKKIIELEEKAKEKGFKNREEIKEYLEESLRGSSKFFKI